MTDADARRLLRQTRQKLASCTACSSDHRPAIEAIMRLPDDEANRWLEEIRVGFIAVYAREQATRRRVRLGAPTTPITT